MKTKIFSLLALAGISLAMGSCSDNPDYPLDKQGATGSVSLSDLGVVVNADEQTISRADDIDTSGFLVRIVDADGATAYEATVATCNEIVTLPVADGYTVQVHSHEVENAAWEAPYYYGQTAFDIKANEITEIGTVNCTFSNVRVTVKYSDELRAIMGDDVVVTVKCSENGSSLDFAHTEKRSGYFKALEGSTTLAAEFAGTVQGRTAHLLKALTDVKAGQHRIITFGVKTGNSDVPDEFGGISIEGDASGIKLADGLWLTADVTTETVNGNVDVDEKGDASAQRPGKEDPVNPGPDDPNPPVPGDDAVKIEAAGMSFTDVMDPSTITDGVVIIRADKGVENLFVEIVPGGDEFADVLNSVEVPLNFDLAHTKDATERTAMEGFNFPVDEQIVGKSEVKFDITMFVPLLSMYAGEPKFILTVVDAEGNQCVKTLSFKVVK